MGRQERLVVNFHGIGEPHALVPSDETRYWCPLKQWPYFADAIAQLADRLDVSVQVTFDDGNASDFETALPALDERGIRATFFVCAGRLGLSRYLSKKQVQELRDAGHYIGSHGWAHRDLRRLSEPELDREIVGSRDVLSETVQRPVDLFAVPFGSYDRRVLRRLRGWRAVYTSDPGRARSETGMIERYSYVTAWSPSTLAVLATESPTLMQAGRRRLVRVIKRLR